MWHINCLEKSSKHVIFELFGQRKKDCFVNCIKNFLKTWILINFLSSARAIKTDNNFIIVSCLSTLNTCVNLPLARWLYLCDRYNHPEMWKNWIFLVAWLRKTLNENDRELSVLSYLAYASYKYALTDPCYVSNTRRNYKWNDFK